MVNDQELLKGLYSHLADYINESERRWKYHLSNNQLKKSEDSTEDEEWLRNAVKDVDFDKKDDSLVIFKGRIYRDYR